jgi:predicted MPP superfamily phosphohydrolase
MSAAAATIVFGAIDWLLIAMLPHLGLSFGPVGLPLFLITLLRLLIAVFVVWLWRLVTRRRTGLGPKAGLGGMVILIWLINAGVLACEVDGLYFEPFNLTVTEVTLPAPALLPKNPFRIVQISDLHVERTTKRERAVVERVKALKPDMIVLTGDYLNSSYFADSLATRDVRWLAKQLQAPYGVYAIMVEPDDTPESMEEMFGGLGITVLRDEVQWVDIGGEGIYLVGVSFTDRRRDRAVFRELMKTVPPGAYTLLLYHPPDMAEAAADEGVDLYLAGHTHGGQMRLPLLGAVYTNSVYGKKYEQGKYNLGKTTMYVSRGIGMEGQGAPRGRFLGPPEIVTIDLTQGGSGERIQ